MTAWPLVLQDLLAATCFLCLRIVLVLFSYMLLLIDFLGPCLHQKNVADYFSVSQQSDLMLLQQFILVP